MLILPVSKTHNHNVLISLLVFFRADFSIKTLKRSCRQNHEYLLIYDLGVVFDSKLNWKENIISVLKKVNSRMYCMRKLRSFGVNAVRLVTFYNAVICSSIMFGSVCWGGNISKLDRGRLEKIVKKRKEKKAGHVVRKPLDSFKALHEKRLYRKLKQILNDPTHPVRHYFDSRCSNRSGRFLLPRTNTNC